MADKSLDILLRITTEKKGADAVAEIKKVREEARAAGQSTKNYDDVLKQLGQNTEEAAEKTKKAGSEIGNLRGAVGRLTAAVPGLGVAMQAVFNPMTAVVTAAVLTWRHFSQSIAEANARFDEIERSAAASTGVIEAQRDAVDKGKTAWANYRAALMSAINNDPIKTAFDERKKLLEAEAKAFGLSPEEVSKRGMEGMKAELNERVSAQMGLDAVAGRAHMESQETGSRATFNSTEIGRLRELTKRGGELEEEITKAEKKLTGAQMFAGVLAASLEIPAESVDAYVKKTTQIESDALNTAKTRLSSEKRTLAIREEQQLPVLTDAALAAQQAADAKAASVDNRRRVGELQRGIPLENRIGAIEQAGRGGDAGRTLFNAAEGADKILSGAPAEPTQANAINELGGILRARGMTDKQILQYLSQLNDNERALATGLNSLAQDLARTKQQVKDVTNGVSRNRSTH
jgi:hypothetical protein